MMIVPVKGDRITTEDSSAPVVVSSYTNLKTDPAVYISGNTAESAVFFSTIETINGVKVSYNESSKVFDSLGPLRRKIDLPQPGDSITVKIDDVDQSIVVKSIKLHDRSKKSFGLLVVTQDRTFDLSEVRGISTKEKVSSVDYNQFKKYYLDYFPLSK